jgi:hypothetical protein
MEYLEAMMEWYDFVECCLIYLFTMTQEYKL